MRLRGYRIDDNLFWREPARGRRQSFRLRSDFERGFPPLGKLVPDLHAIQLLI